MNYTTQMDAARKGILTKELLAVAKKEQMEPEKLVKLVAAGQVVIPANKCHTCLDPNGIGSALRTKINVNLGTSRDLNDLDMELQKVNDAVAMGAESIMDLSSFGDTQKFRRKLTAECPAIIGTVPIYDAVVYYHKPLREITSEEWLQIAEMHAKDGVDFLTIHVGINKNTAERFKKMKRLTNIVSRGGSIIFAWMEMTGQENPFYEHFDRLLDICQEYDVTLSLGDACRPGCLEDATDVSQLEELLTLGDPPRLGEKCPGHDRRSGTYAARPDRCQYENSAVRLQGRPVLRARSAGDGRRAGLRPYHGCHRRRNRSIRRCFLPLLRDPGRAPSPAEP